MRAAAAVVVRHFSMPPRVGYGYRRDSDSLEQAMDEIRVAVAGAGGRMGRTLVTAVHATGGLRVSAATERSSCSIWSSSQPSM